MRFQIKKRILIFYMAGFLLLLTLGAGIAIVYSDYLYTPNKGFTLMNVSSTDPDFQNVFFGGADEETTARVREKTGVLTGELDRWAAENHASILLRNMIPYYPHVSISLHSDLRDRLKIRPVSDEESGLYVDQAVMEDPYLVRNDIFLPIQYGMKIEGSYDPAGLPKALQDQGFFLLSLQEYQLPVGTPYLAQIITDAEDVTGLIEVLKKNRVTCSNIQENETEVLKRLRSLFYPIGFYNGVLLLIFAAAIGSFLFLTLMQFRRTENFQIRHLNGKPLYRIGAEVFLSGILLFVLAYGILFILLPKYCSYMSGEDIARIRSWVARGLLSVVLVSYAAAVCRLLVKLRRR